MNKMNITPEQVQEMEETIESLREEVKKYKGLVAEVKEQGQTLVANTESKYEEMIDRLNKEHQEEVEELQDNIKLMEGHIDMLIHDNTVMDAQLDIVRMMCGVKE